MQQKTLFRGIFSGLLSIVSTFFLFQPDSLLKVILFLALSLGACLSLFYFIDKMVRNLSLRDLNTATFGLFFGSLFGMVLLFAVESILTVSFASSIPVVRAAVLLISSYGGLSVAINCRHHFFVIPFLNIKQSKHRKRGFVLDLCALNDSRIIDLARFSLIEPCIVVPEFLLNQLNFLATGSQEDIRKSKRPLAVLRKLEAVPNLEVVYESTQSNSQDPQDHVIELAKKHGYSLITSNTSPIFLSDEKCEIPIINIHSLANALKPITQAGESLKIKIQRQGKEVGQGVGYLDDGTMVVVNNGANYIGEFVLIKVLSVKHTPAGRIIFCNFEEHLCLDEEYQESELQHI